MILSPPPTTRATDSTLIRKFGAWFCRRRSHMLAVLFKEHDNNINSITFWRTPLKNNVPWYISTLIKEHSTGLEWWYLSKFNQILYSLERPSDICKKSTTKDPQPIIVIWMCARRMIIQIIFDSELQIKWPLLLLHKPYIIYSFQVTVWFNQ